MKRPIARPKPTPKPMLHKGPWLVPAAARVIEGALASESCVFETGAGGSTLWFADRAAHVTTYEQDPLWHALVKAEIAKLGLTNVDLYLDPSYPVRGFDLAPDIFDVALIDGRGRVKTVETIWKSLKPSGILVLDNSERPRYAQAKQFLADKCSTFLAHKSGWETTIWWKAPNG